MKRYQGLLDRAAMLTRPKDSIHADLVFYSVRDPLTSWVYDAKERVYRGKLSRGDCVDATDLQAMMPKGLSARKMLFRCARKPDPSKVYQIGAVHRRNEGLLRDEVTCTILAGHRGDPLRDH